MSSWKRVDDHGFMSTKNRTTLCVDDLEDAPPKNKEETLCVIGMLLESESEAVSRGVVCSARSSCRRRISRMPCFEAKITLQ